MLIDHVLGEIVIALIMNDAVINRSRSALQSEEIELSLEWYGTIVLD